MTAKPSREDSEFAALLHRQRRAAGLTQADLAQQSGLAVRTVRDVERGRTSRVQRTTAVLLADALGLVGAERIVFLAAARGEAGRQPGAGDAGTQREPPDAGSLWEPGAAAARGVPLPPSPPLVGREEELGRLAELLLDRAGPGAPLALVGVAGVGKSALALALAHRVAPRFPGGVAGIVVDHDSLAAEVVDAVATVFGVSRGDQLPARLAAGPALLLVDAVERAPEEVCSALGRLPDSLRVLVTGRRPLGLPAECVWPVLPLELPPAEPEADLAEVVRYPAAALLLNRLERVRPEPLAADEVPALAGLARRLGGLPLALELAAGHGRLLRLPEVLERYGDRVLDLGVTRGGAEPGVESTLREAVAGSYWLLTPVEQRALRRLAAFRNRWSMELAEQLLAEEPGRVTVDDPVPLLDRLVSLGLVGLRGVRENRFRLLDVVRDFALEQAERFGELASTRRAHAVVMARLASRSVPALAGGGLAAAVARLDDVAGELWSALNYAANDDPQTALWLASSLPWWWRFRGRDVAGRRWLRRLLDDPRTAQADPVVRAWAQLGLAQLAYEHGEGGAERPEAEAARDEFRRVGEVAGELAATVALGSVAWADGDYDQAKTCAEAALRLATRTGRLRDAMVAQHNLLWHEVRVGDLAAARRRLAAVDRLAAQAGEHRVRVVAAASLAEVARLEGRYEESVTVGARALSRLGELGDPGHRRQVLGTLGRSFAALGRTEDAERALETLRQEADPRVRSPDLDGVCALIEGRLAWVRGDWVGAAEWFAAAAVALRGGQDPRQVVEALVALAASQPDPLVRGRTLEELAEFLGDGGFTLLPLERELLRRNGRGRSPM